MTTTIAWLLVLGASILGIAARDWRPHVVSLVAALAALFLAYGHRL